MRTILTVALTTSPFGDLLWRSVGQVGTGTVHVFENDTGPDDANHAHEGLYVLAAEDGPHGPGQSATCATSLRRFSSCSRAGPGRHGRSEMLASGAHLALLPRGARMVMTL